MGLARVAKDGKESWHEMWLKVAGGDVVKSLLGDEPQEENNSCKA